MSGNEQLLLTALSHPEMAVRDRALQALGSAHPHCTAAMPAVIRAIEQYGWDEAFASLHFAHLLPQNPDTIAWAWQHLLPGVAAGRKDEPWYCYDLACLIAYAASGARDRAAEAEHLAKLRDGLAQLLARPIELSELSDDDLWRRYEADTHRWNELREGNAIELTQLGIALGSRGERFAPQLLEALQVGEDQHIDAACRVAAVAMGAARYRPAVKQLVDYLGVGDTAFEFNLAERALAQIGGADVVAEMAARMQGEEFFQQIGSRVFGVVASEEALTAGLEALQRVRSEIESRRPFDEEIADFGADLADALLFHLDPRVIAPAAEYARLMKDHSFSDPALEDAIGVTATLLDVDLPEKEAWLQQAQEEAAAGRSREAEPVDVSSVASDNVFYEGFDPANLPAAPSVDIEPLEIPRRRRRLAAMRPVPGPGAGADQRLIPIRRSDSPIGRNDPCPCGSGKKYKNCCLRKD